MAKIFFYVCAGLFLLLTRGTCNADTGPPFLLQWGGHGYADGQFAPPYGIASGIDGNIYVCDAGGERVERFSQQGQFLGAWGGLGHGDQQFQLPVGIATDASGDVFVTDINENCIRKFTSTGGFLARWGTEGFNFGQFEQPYGIAVAPDGIVYVADTFNNRVQRFTNAGAFIDHWGQYGTGAGFLDTPTGIVVDANGLVYVAQTGSASPQDPKVQVFTSDGQYLASWTFSEAGPQQIACDRQGAVYVNDYKRVMKFSSSGALLSEWGQAGSGPGEFNVGFGVTVDSAGNVYTTEQQNCRVLKYGELPVPSRGSSWGQVKSTYRK